MAILNALPHHQIHLDPERVTPSEEVEGAPTAKSARTSEALSTGSNDHEPKPTLRVPLLEKICQGHINKDTY